MNLPTKLARLESLAEAATPGPYYDDEGDGVSVEADDDTEPDTTDGRVFITSLSSGLGLRQVLANHAYFAALDPAVVRAMIVVCREARLSLMAHNQEKTLQVEAELRKALCALDTAFGS